MFYVFNIIYSGNATVDWGLSGVILQTLLGQASYVQAMD